MFILSAWHVAYGYIKSMMRICNIDNRGTDNMYSFSNVIIYSNSSPNNGITVFIPRACEWNKYNKCTSLRVHLLQLSHELASEITVVIPF